MKKKFEKIYLTVNLIFSSLMIFYELFPMYLIMLVSLIFVIWSLIYLNKRLDFQLSLIFTSVAMIPTSFISILGNSTSSFPISWFHILIIIITMLICLKGKVDKIYFLGILFFSIYGICSSLLQPNVFDAMKQVLMIILFFFSFFIGDYCIKKTDKEKYFFLYKLYIYGALSIAVQVVIQYILNNSIGLQIGNVGYYANRIAYGGLMEDYSFATTYIATGFMAVMLEYFEYRILDLKKFIFLEIILTVGMITVTARTGLYALAIIIVLYFVTNLNRFRLRYMLVIVVGILMVPLLIDILIANRGGQALLDGSGRMDEYLYALEIYSNHVLCGIGFGLKNLVTGYSMTVPHNFFIQYLLQAGLIGLILIMIPFIRFFVKIIKKVDYSIWLFVLIVVASMAIPDITSSRFLYAVVVLNYMSYFNKKLYEYEEEEKND